MKVAPYIQKLISGSRLKYPELETELLNWFMIQAKAANRAVYQEIYMNINTAKFSQKWIDSFMTHYNLVNRRKTTVAQQLSNNYIE